MKLRNLLIFAAALAVNGQTLMAQWKAPRTPDGHPDLQGVWSNTSLTPFERPRELGTKEFFTKEEAAAFAARTLQQNNRDRRGTTPEEDVGLSYNEAWFERGSSVSPNMRTSIVIDPKDGRIPELTSEGRAGVARRSATIRRTLDTPRDFALNVRCLLWGTAGPPMLPGPYNNMYQIIQTKDFVAIQVEMIHDTRIIPLDGRPHLTQGVSQWMGDSIGRWEGEALVVETTNFRDDTSFRGTDSKLRLTERFMRTSPETLTYQFTIDNPSAFTRPWTGELVMTAAPGPIYEYACHEGNEALPNMMRGARRQEQGQ